MKLRYSAHKNLKLDVILSQINQVNNFTFLL
jgi:hypothetical protein